MASKNAISMYHISQLESLRETSFSPEFEFEKKVQPLKGKKKTKQKPNISSTSCIPKIPLFLALVEAKYPSDSTRKICTRVLQGYERNQSSNIRNSRDFTTENFTKEKKNNFLWDMEERKRNLTVSGRPAKNIDHGMQHIPVRVGSLSQLALIRRTPGSVADASTRRKSQSLIQPWTLVDSGRQIILFHVIFYYTSQNLLPSDNFVFSWDYSHHRFPYLSVHSPIRSVMDQIYHPCGSKSIWFYLFGMDKNFAEHFLSHPFHKRKKKTQI